MFILDVRNEMVAKVNELMNKFGFEVRITRRHQLMLMKAFIDVLLTVLHGCNPMAGTTLSQVT